MKFVTVGVLSFAALLGCSSRNIDTIDAVKQGVISDIAKNINVSAMDVSVVSVSFRDKEADAVVSFAPKGMPAAQGLTMKYTMERRGNEWHIKSRAESELQKHAAQAQGAGSGQDSTQLPPGHPPMGGADSGTPGTQLPPGHPPMGGGDSGTQGTQLPPGHPPLGSKQ
ncbi:MAG: hypothetical protein KGN84_22170 [Acidobacteriota bacterium]|nr:hypothetical protein [Acidobacteriota bacterium]